MFYIQITVPVTNEVFGVLAVHDPDGLADGPYFKQSRQLGKAYPFETREDAERALADFAFLDLYYQYEVIAK